VVRGLLDRFDLDPTRRIGELSTGNRRKVGVVQASAGNPELLILDEPTSGLDPLLQHELLTLLEERVGDGATVFLSSHVLPEVERVADRIAILRRGRLVALGTVEDVRAGARQRIDLHLADPVDATTFRKRAGRRGSRGPRNHPHRHRRGLGRPGRQTGRAARGASHREPHTRPVVPPG
jgi:ABC-2 type transport system ATP-binding protein